MATGERYVFGGFTLDVPERRLAADDGTAAVLAPKAYDLLVTLVRNAGRLVEKDDLLRKIWPDAHVEEGILTVHVAALRKALADSSRAPRYIETVPRSGYRFIAPVSKLSGLPNQIAAGNGQSAGAEIHELMGRGRFHLLSASRGEVQKAVASFKAVVDREPHRAAAHAGLALACCAQAEQRLAPPSEAYRAARDAALRALAMDDANADAQLALGAVLFLSEWNWIGAERSLRRALELNPDYTEAYLLYGRLLEALGRVDEGLDMKLRALERDPFSPAVHLQIAQSYWNQRRFDDAIAWANKTLALDPQHLLAGEFLASAYWGKKDFDRHLQEEVRRAESFGVPRDALQPLEMAYAAGGRAGVVRYLLDSSEAGAFPAIQLAVLHGEAGNLDAAFQHLERAIEARDPALVHLAVAPQWDSLRADPRFAGCLTRLGLG